LDRVSHILPRAGLVPQVVGITSRPHLWPWMFLKLGESVHSWVKWTSLMAVAYVIYLQHNRLLKLGKIHLTTGRGRGV
jgi:hypothetical protein